MKRYDYLYLGKCEHIHVPIWFLVPEGLVGVHRPTYFKDASVQLRTHSHVCTHKVSCAPKLRMCVCTHIYHAHAHADVTLHYNTLHCTAMMKELKRHSAQFCVQ